MLNRHPGIQALNTHFILEAGIVTGATAMLRMSEISTFLITVRHEASLKDINCNF
jgi:hypothetical protein